MQRYVVCRRASTEIVSRVGSTLNPAWYDLCFTKKKKKINALFFHLLLPWFEKGELDKHYSWSNLKQRHLPNQRWLCEFITIGFFSLSSEAEQSQWYIVTFRDKQLYFTDIRYRRVLSLDVCRSCMVCLAQCAVEKQGCIALRVTSRSLCQGDGSWHFLESSTIHLRKKRPILEMNFIYTGSRERHLQEDTHMAILPSEKSFYRLNIKMRIKCCTRNMIHSRRKKLQLQQSG